MQMKQIVLIVTSLFLWSSAHAIDSSMYQRYKSYKSSQQSQQLKELERARAAARAGDFSEAEDLLDVARDMAYSPEEIHSVEKLIASERQRRERLAEEERQRKARIAAREKAEREAREAADRAQRTVDSGSTGLASSGAVKHELDWSYDYRSIYVPATYRTELKRNGFFSNNYHWETSQDTPGYTHSELVRLYFSVNLKNTSNQRLRVKYKISAMEKIGVGKVVGNAFQAGMFALLGAVFSEKLGLEPKEGAMLGAGGALAYQKSTNQWFKKEKTFTAILEPNGEIYEGGYFPVSKTLTKSPELEIVSVERVD